MGNIISWAYAQDNFATGRLTLNQRSASEEPTLEYRLRHNLFTINRYLTFNIHGPLITPSMASTIMESACAAINPSGSFKSI